MPDCQPQIPNFSKSLRESRTAPTDVPLIYARVEQSLAAKPFEKFEGHYLEKIVRVAPNRVFRWSFCDSRVVLGNVEWGNGGKHSGGRREKRHGDSVRILLLKRKPFLSRVLSPSAMVTVRSAPLKITSCKKRATNGTGVAGEGRDGGNYWVAIGSISRTPKALPI